MQKKPLSVRFDVEAVNDRADIIALYADIERSKVIRAALVIGLNHMASVPESMSSDEAHMMVHKSQEVPEWT